MEPGIEFRIIYRDNEVIKVRISASNGCFCGSAHVYLGTGQLADIAAQLLGFPKNISDTREIVLGALRPQFAGGCVSMRFYCVDSAGHARAAIRIESGQDSEGANQSAQLLMPIEANWLDSFISELRSPEVEVARLCASNLELKA